MNRSRRISGFTLVELLIVVAIFAMLMTILVPSFNIARQLAKRAVCMSNLHNIGRSTIMYAEENKGVFPDLCFDFSPGNSGTVVVLIKPRRAATSGWQAFDLSSMVCPSDESPSKVSMIDENGDTVQFPISYGYNIELSLHQILYDNIPNKERVLMFCDGTMGAGSQGHYDPSRAERYFARGEIFQTRHLNAANALFVDGHVETVTEVTSDMTMSLPYTSDTTTGNGNGNNDTSSDTTTDTTTDTTGNGNGNGNNKNK